MDERTRRAFLGLCLGAAGAVAGCLSGDPSGPGDPGTSTPGDGTGATDATDVGEAAASLSFDGADPLHRVGAGFPQLDAEDHYLALLTEADHVAAFPTDRFRNDEASAFLDDTDFSKAVVVVVHDRLGSSVPDLELRDALIDDSTAVVEAEYPGEAGTDDVITETMLVRITTGGASVTAADATIHPQYGDSIRLSTEDEDATATAD